MTRWRERRRCVSDVMTTSVVNADPVTPYQEIDRLLTENKISGLPVLRVGRKVIGVVSEADLLAAEDETARQSRLSSTLPRRWWVRRQPHLHLTAERLMTTPAITIGADATIPAATRLMNTHHVRRLPVVNDEGELVGIVSRRDLLSVFLRPDDDIVHNARQVLDELPLANPMDVVVAVRRGVVTLTGTIRPGPGDDQDLLLLVLRLIWDIDGVIDVVNRLGQVPAARTAKTPGAIQMTSEPT
jgi:CBS domain-containing protein